MLATASIETGYLQVSSAPDIRLYYTVEGPLDSSKPMILLSSSLAANIHLWDDFTAAFKNKYTVIRYDARFHGQSPLSSDPSFDYAAGHTMEDLANDVLRLLDHLHIKRIKALVGLSIGAALGLIFGAKHPDRVEHVVVVGTRATSNPTSNANHTMRIKFGYENGSQALGRQSIDRWFDREWAASHPERIAHAEEVYCKQSVQGYEASIAALRILDLFPYAMDIGERADGNRFVLIAGELDGTVPQESKALGDLMGSKVVIMPGSGHITPIQMPDIFHTEVARVII